jgi:hypothetical protein
MKSFFELSKQLVEAKDEFKPHKMYDPKTGEAYDADTEADHLKYKKMGYTHEKPEVNEAFKARQLKKMKRVKGNMSMADADGPKAKKAYGMGQTYAGANELKHTDYSNYIENKSGVKDVYFDGVDLVVGDKTVVKNAKHSKMTPDQLADEVKKFASKLKEGFSPKEIKMAIGIASDPRYKGGNMTGAVRAIDKIKKGLSGHKQVMAVLKRQNEDIEEAMSPKEKAAHAKAIADFKKRGGKVKKLKPGYAQGWTGKDDLGTGQKGMLGKSDTSKFGTKKRVKSMRAHVENTELDEKVYSKPAKLDPAIAKDPKVKAAQKAHAKGDWDGNVDKEGNAVVHVKGKPHTVTVQMESMNEATNMFTDDRVGFQIDRFAMGQGKVGFQINYGKKLGRYIQVPMDDMKRVIAQMTKAMKAKI